MNTERYLKICTNLNLSSMTVHSASFPSHGVDSLLPFSPSAPFAPIFSFPGVQHIAIER